MAIPGKVPREWRGRGVAACRKEVATDGVREGESHATNDRTAVLSRVISAPIDS
jgi:hypothetical protein